MGAARRGNPSHRWDITVESCAYLPPRDEEDDQDFGRIQIALTATNTWTETLLYLEHESYLVTLPNGDQYGGKTWEWMTFRDRENSGGFDPGFTRPVEMRADLLTPHWGTDSPIHLAFASERTTDGFLISGDWVADRPVAQLELECPTEGAP